MSGTQSSLPGPVARLWEPLRGRSRSRRALLLMAPLLIFELLLFVAPFLILVRISLTSGSSDLRYAPGTWSLEGYAEVFTNGVLLDPVVYSFGMGLAATATAVVIAVCYAYAIWRAEGFVESALLFSVVLPLLTTLVIKTYAFWPLLSPNGTLNDLLLSLHLVSEPVQFVPGTVGVVVGQVYIVLPYAVLAIYSVLSTMDWGIVEAARDLGASRPRSVLEVVVPQAMPGIIVATVISFAWSVGAYAAPGLLGGGANRTFAIEVEQRLLSNLQWELATAYAVVMLLLMFGSVAAITAVLNHFGGEFEYA
ncbi:ABC transporter permease [Natrinema salaciae]|uniref:Spermidine/putrescine transport system permease protein n=1 Tax=Natrinema salaciae TaxID=1186196 RepID=A0A1H9BDI1_9EURY|nr:ABC transporter permease [Natrinema salaciae]SEP86703.1 spermidine/putrescine transport system permease protein [Natrinema salaciae]